MVLIRWSTVLCLLAAVIATAVAFAPAVSPFLTRIKHAPSSSPLWALKDDFHTIWKRLDDTVEASGVAEDYPDHPPLVQRGFGFRRFLIIMAVGMLYKWYRARFINKIPFWEKQPQWNMVVTNKDQDKQLRAYTCKNCGSTLFIARNREWFFEGGTGLAGLGCYSCGAKGADNFVMDRDRIVDEVGDEDDYWDFERPLDFVSAAERKALLKQTKGDVDAANQILLDQAAEATKTPPPPPMFAATAEEEAAKQKEAAEEEESESDEKEEPKIIIPPPPEDKPSPEKPSD